jgi:hypothetical protein
MRFDELKRRELLTLLGGAAVVWPRAVRAQPERMRRIGVLMNIVDGPLVACFNQFERI